MERGLATDRGAARAQHISARPSRPLSRGADLLRTLCRLGMVNVASVVFHRGLLRAGLHPVQRLPPSPAADPPYFIWPGGDLRATPTGHWGACGNYFGWYRPVLIRGIPDWHEDPFDGARPEGSRQPWWHLGDFDYSGLDVKRIWEASRMDWVMAMAQRATQAPRELQRLNEWIADWIGNNPPYRGHNWKCGQEASIRVIHLAVAALELGVPATMRDGLKGLLVMHLRRVAPTTAYATAQDNNHGTSEAAALFIGGSWLERCGLEEGAAWHRQGRRMLEERAGRIIEPDGTFSQYSVNYQRLVLDTYSIAEVWRRRFALSPFTPSLHSRLAAASEWLYTMVDPTSGDAPNIGENDGANLLPLTDADYRDFRPSVHLASVLFNGVAPFRNGESCVDQLRWLGVVPTESDAKPPSSRVFDHGGFAVLRRGDSMAVLRYPRFRFRPSHADALHLDLWVGGQNVLRDGGSFSYHSRPDYRSVLAGAAGHNTVEFDGRDQMPRIGRFLWGEWLSTDAVVPLHSDSEIVRFGAAYRDCRGARHERLVGLGPGQLEVVDSVEGFASRALVRWRLIAKPWYPVAGGYAAESFSVVIDADVPVVRQELVKGVESRYYLRIEELPVIELEVERPGRITTTVRWSP